MASQLQGIQQPRRAEKREAEKREAEKVFEARKKVSKAHKQKNRRLKQAEEEAQAETEQYRLQRKKEFKAEEAATLGSHGSCSSEVEKVTQEKMTSSRTTSSRTGMKSWITSWPLCVTSSQKSMKTTA